MKVVYFNTVNNMNLPAVCHVCIVIAASVVVKLHVVDCKAQSQSTGINDTADILCSLCRGKNNTTCIIQWCMHAVIVREKRDVNAENPNVIVSMKRDVNDKNPGDKVRSKVLNKLLFSVGNVISEKEINNKRFRAQPQSTSRSSVVTADIICSLCREKNNTTCILQWCMHGAIFRKARDVNAENYGDKVRGNV